MRILWVHPGSHITGNSGSSDSKKSEVVVDLWSRQRSCVSLRRTEEEGTDQQMGLIMDEVVHILCSDMANYMYMVTRSISDSQRDVGHEVKSH